MTTKGAETQKEDARGEQILTVDDLNVEYSTKEGPVRALRDVSIELRQGETLGIAGESGSGKSTLALAILRYLGENGHVTDGNIHLHDKSLLEMSSRELRSLRGKEIAHVAQDPEKSLNPSMVVGDQIAESIRLHQEVGQSIAHERTYEILEDVGISDPEVSYEQYPHELSGGMQQRILIAMALSCNPDVLILDEPTTGLDVTTQAKILNLINDLKTEFDTGILLITHNLSILATVADRVGILYAGEIMEKGPADRVFASPSNPYTQGLLTTIPEIETRKKLTSIPGQIPDLTDVPEGCIFADRCQFAEPACREGTIETERVDEYHETRCLRWETAVENPIESEEVPDRQSTRGEQILEVSNLHKHYDAPGFVDSLFGSDPPVKAVNGIDLSLYEGESLALVGESGCGKSTLGRTILGLIEATSGEVSFRGNPMSEMTDEDYQRFRSECQVVFQNPESSLNPRKSIFNIIARPLRVFTDYDEDERRERVAELLSQVGLSPAYASRDPHELSGGEQQRIAIARAFAAEPSFVVLDEPVSSLDVSVQANILDLLDTLRDRYNTSYLFISHDLSVVRHLCDRIAVMYLGEIVETGAVAGMFNEPRHPYTEALIESIPSLNPTASEGRMATLEGEVPSPRDPPTGCKFHTRCPYAREVCVTDEPEDILSTEDDDGNRRRQAACFRTDANHAYWSSDPLKPTDSDTG